ncbi:MAG: glucokinase [Pseudanabaenaceae cyanobacterium bins.68]|nr:glucokinase [Pseudanabaenaceae cyanobacterium bins.68]
MWTLAGDVGGTKTLMRLCQAKKHESQPLTAFDAKFESAKFANFNQLIQAFILEASDSLGEQINLIGACFGIAGAVNHNCSTLTNLGWQLDGSEIAEVIGIPHVHLINDFAAIGHGLLGLGRDDLFTLQEGEPRVRAPIALIGAGTGLGQAYLTWDGHEYQVHNSEGGHTDFAPRTALEIELLQYLQRKLQGRVSVERVVSGRGITNIYEFLCDRSPQSAATLLTQAIAQQDPTSGDPAALIAAARGYDPLAAQTMTMFMENYGAEAGNLALKLLPYGGLYIAGGIAAKNLELFRQGNFLAAFHAKGRMSTLLSQIPVQIIANQEVGLIGASLYAAKRFSFE